MSRAGWRLVYALASAVLLPAGMAAQATGLLNGYWDLRVPAGDGTYRETFFELHQAGDAVTGRLLGRGSDGLPVTGTLSGATLHLTATPPAESKRPPIAFEGTFSSGKLILQSRNASGEVSKGEAVQTTEQASKPPAPLPLPALKELPDNGLVRTPPMGWNSWNKFAGRITDADVRSMADAMVSSGMSKLGYVYINIDDTWELGRDNAGNITTNTKFPDMKALADYVHSKGLKIGIYSSPGPKTCAGYEASFGHEVQDARSYASWGIDYLKYDLCSAGGVYTSSPETQRALYQKMGEALQQTGRPIVFSLCQYGQEDVWNWGAKAGGNLWRTTGDIEDAWKSMDDIGFRQLPIAKYTVPGHWNDPDMLEIGNGGMTAEEYRTHMSLWSLLSAPLIAGNDLRTMTDETRSILMNPEVIAVDQDSAAKPTQVLATEGSLETLWRPMADGSVVVGVFNRSEKAASANVSLATLPLAANSTGLRGRDLWKHSAVPLTGNRLAAPVPAHGVYLVRVSAT